MCGKFSGMLSWSEMVAFAQPLPEAVENGNDRLIIYRVMSALPVIVWDHTTQSRRVVPMRWGFPKPTNWKIPQPIHARAETIDTIPAFADAFHAGQRGIVIAKNFNEAPESGEQFTITPGDEPFVALAFVWRRFAIPELPTPLLACVMATVPANALIASLPTDRMPAVLAEDDWAKWLDEKPCSAAEAKACLKTVQGIRWRMAKEERPQKRERAPTML